jgi:hypothetical protein
MESKSDHELLAIFTHPEDWSDEAISAAKLELEKRRLTLPEKKVEEVDLSEKASEHTAQGLNLKQLTTIGIGGGLVLKILGSIVFQVREHNAGAAGMFMNVAGTILFIWGCKHFVVGKGYNAWLAVLGILSCVGLFILIILPDRRKEFDDHA